MMDMGAGPPAGPIWNIGEEAARRLFGRWFFRLNEHVITVWLSTCTYCRTTGRAVPSWLAATNYYSLHQPYPPSSVLILMSSSCHQTRLRPASYFSLAPLRSLSFVLLPQYLRAITL